MLLELLENQQSGSRAGSQEHKYDTRGNPKMIGQMPAMKHRELENGTAVRFRLSSGRASRAFSSLGRVVQSGALRSLVRFQAPLISSRASSDQMWIDNTNLVKLKKEEQTMNSTLTYQDFDNYKEYLEYIEVEDENTVCDCQGIMVL